MKKLTTLFAALFLCLGLAQAQDVFYSGNGNGTGKIWKNDSLLYNLTDSINVQLKALQVAEDGTTYGAGYAFDSVGIQGRIWMNDSCVFAGDTNTYFDHLVLTANGWTAAGGNKVWQNGTLLFEYPLDTATVSNIYALTIDTVTGDIYAGGTTVTPGVYASVWKNDTLLWMADAWSSVEDLCFDGENLYATGFMYVGDTLIHGIIWQNDSIIYQMENASFGHIAAFNGSIYWSGVSTTDTIVYIWQDGEVLYALPELSGISNLVVNENGVYYSDAQTVYKDGEILYQPECIITDLVVIPSSPEPPVPMGTLTVMVNDTLMGSVIGEGTYPLGDTVTIEAFPNVGYTFLYWNDSITDNPLDVVITQDSTFTAYFGIVEYTIAATADPENGGTITGGGLYHYGDTITLEAVANAEYVFEMWDDSITDNPRDIVVTQDSNFVALFSHLPCTIETQVMPEGTGFVTGAGTYPYGDTIQLEATPNMGYEFMTWDDGITDNPRTIVVTESHVYTATFGIRQCVVNTVAQPAEGGTVIGSGTYSYGDTILLVAQSNTGFQFKAWDDDNLDNPRQIIVEDDVTYTAIFSPLQYEITTGCEPAEGGTVEGAGFYNYGSTAVLYARPADNYNFVCWNDGIVSNPRYITVTQNASYTALFNYSGVPQHAVKVIPNNPDWGTVTGEGTYPEGSVIEISATPTDSTRFVSWDDGNTDNPRYITVTNTMIIVAIFEPLPNYTITVRSISETMGVTYGSGTYPANMTVSIGAIPAQGFYFTGWQDGDMNNPRNITVTEDAEYVAYFSQTPVQTYTVTVYYDEDQGLILGAGTYSAGATATLVAIPADGFMFAKWSDGTTNVIKEVVVDHDIVLAAFFTGTGVDEGGNETFSLYPNPANDIIRIEGLDGEHEVMVYNIYGTLVKTANIEGDGEINVNDLAAGIYFLRVGSHAMKFVKE